MTAHAPMTASAGMANSSAPRAPRRTVRSEARIHPHTASE